MQKYCVLSLIRLIIGSAYTVYASEAATRGVLLKSVSLKISQNSKSFRLGTLWKKRLRHRCCPVNFVKFLRTPFLQNISGQLLLLRVWLDLCWYSCENIKNILINLTVKVCTLIYTRNYITYTRNQNHNWKVLCTHTKGNRNFLVFSTGKKIN